MEYEIYNESLVYYALRNDFGMYLAEGTDLNEVKGSREGYLAKALKFSNVQEAIVYRNRYPNFSKIRKVKVIDIGEVKQ